MCVDLLVDFEMFAKLTDFSKVPGASVEFSDYSIGIRTVQLKKIKKPILIATFDS